MNKAVFLSCLAILAACGVPADEDISSRSDYAPLGKQFFIPVDPTVLENSKAWAEVVRSYE